MNTQFLEIEFGTPAYDQSIRLRDQLLRKPLGLAFSEEDLAQEWNQYHIAGFDAQQHIQSILVFKVVDDQTLKMRQVAVSEQLQGQGIGKKMVRFSEAWAKHRQYQHIELNARKGAVAFYESMDYKKQGKAFIEVGIEHYKMVKSL